MKIYLTILALGILGSTAPLRAEDQKAVTVCPVSGEKIGGDDMGKPYTFTYEGQQVTLCCKGCKEDFDKDPSKYLSKQDKDAKASQ